MRIEAEPDSSSGVVVLHGDEPDDPSIEELRGASADPLDVQVVHLVTDRTNKGATEAVNGRPEHLRGSTLGFRNLTNYVARSLFEAGGFRPQLHPGFG